MRNQFNAALAGIFATVFAINSLPAQAASSANRGLSNHQHAGQGLSDDNCRAAWVNICGDVQQEGRPSNLYCNVWGSHPC